MTEPTWIPDTFDPENPPPSMDHRLTYCPAGLLPTGSSPIEPCVVVGRHILHRTANGESWFDPETES